MSEHKTIGQILADFGKISEWRERRMDTILDAQRRSTKDKPYPQLRDALLRERGLGTIEE